MSEVIRVVRNEDGNCVHFVGSSTPTYWNGCLSGEVNGKGNIDIINNVSSTDKTPVYEMWDIHWKLFRKDGGETFNDAAECADYITSACNAQTASPPLFPPKPPSNPSADPGTDPDMDPDMDPDTDYPTLPENPTKP